MEEEKQEQQNCWPVLLALFSGWNGINIHVVVPSSSCLILIRVLRRPSLGFQIINNPMGAGLLLSSSRVGGVIWTKQIYCRY